MLSFLKKCSMSRAAWAFVVISSAALEGAALYFQHGMGLQPCVMCIYQRLALLAILVTGLIGLLAPRCWPVRVTALVLGLSGAFKGLQLAFKHTDYQLNPAPWNTCSPFLDFPTFLPLDRWLPNVFAAGGDCGKISWEFLGLVMPQWLMIIFAVYLIGFVLLTVSQFKRVRAKHELFYHKRW